MLGVDMREWGISESMHMQSNFLVATKVKIVLDHHIFFEN
jgi:hypothetical protein